MKSSVVGAVAAAALVSALALSSSVFAKTAKECRAEWTANKAENQAKGITEKDYVAKCRAEASTEKPKSAESKSKEKTTSKRAGKAEKAEIAEPAAAKKKTAKECRAEWAANKAANEAKGITEKAYVAQCRAGTAAMKPPATPTAVPQSAEKKEKASTTVATPTGATKKTEKECQEEWRANKAANQAKGITEKAYVEKCRAGTSGMNPETPTTPPAPTQTKMTPSTAAPAKSTARTESPGMGKPEGANQFAAESAAKAHCPSGTVVWANLDSKIYHFAGHADYGHTKQGAYMCENDAMAEGLRAAKNEKHP